MFMMGTLPPQLNRTSTMKNYPHGLIFLSSSSWEASSENIMLRVRDSKTPWDRMNGIHIY